MDDLRSRRLCSLGPPVVASSDFGVAVRKYPLNYKKVDAMIHQITSQGPPQVVGGRASGLWYPQRLIGKYVRLEQIEEGKWLVYYRNILLGYWTRSRCVSWTGRDE